MQIKLRDNDPYISANWRRNGVGGKMGTLYYQTYICHPADADSSIEVLFITCSVSWVNLQQSRWVSTIHCPISAKKLLMIESETNSNMQVLL